VDRLWAGWRMAYIKRATRAGAGRAPCLFCAKGRLRPGPRNLVLAATPRVVVMLNLFPYNIGHVMVAPRTHQGSLARMSAEEAAEVNEWLGRMERAIKRAYRPHGFNVGLNLGRVAGAGVLGHLHWHVVPRWNGDTNFMPVTGDTKVLPEPIATTYARLRRALDATSAPERRRTRR
jgi:ATP adenylyltransferase